MCIVIWNETKLRSDQGIGFNTILPNCRRNHTADEALKSMPLRDTKSPEAVLLPNNLCMGETPNCHRQYSGDHWLGYRPRLDRTHTGSRCKYSQKCDGISNSHKSPLDNCHHFLDPCKYNPTHFDKGKHRCSGIQNSPSSFLRDTQSHRSWTCRGPMTPQSRSHKGNPPEGTLEQSDTPRRCCRPV